MILTSVVISAHYRSIQEVIHSGIAVVWAQNEDLGRALYNANDFILNGAGFDHERRIKDTIFSSFDSVVMINVYPTDENKSNQAISRLSGRGTGFFVKVDEDTALIMTNHHVVDSYINNPSVMQIGVNTAIDMWSYKATLVGSDPIADIAIIKISKQDNEDWTALEFADYKDISEGDPVVVIGHGMGMPWNNTQGIVTYDGRYGQRPYALMIQTDAVINQGNSGGPMLGMDGKVIGIAQSILSPGRKIPGWDGVGLAVHSRQAVRTYNYIMSDNYAEKGYVPYNEFAIVARNVELDKVKHIAKKDRYLAYIDYTDLPNGAAPSAGQIAGLLQGDILLELNGEKLFSTWKLMIDAVYALPGDVMTIKVLRGTQELTIEVTYRETDYTKLLALVSGRYSGR